MYAEKKPQRGKGNNNTVVVANEEPRVKTRVQNVEGIKAT